MEITAVAKEAELDQQHALELLRQMLLIRRFEEKSAELYSLGKIRGFLHLYIGEEAVAVGAMQALTPDDAIVATYRDHGHALARGIPAGPIMAEMYGKANGCSKGHGGSMHLFDASRRFYGGYAIVGGGLPIAVGLALADRMQGRKRITACFFGEGAAAEGEFHESMNLAALWQLPVLFLCENNLYAMGTALQRSESEPDIRRHARSYNMRAEVADGMDVLAVAAACKQAATALRQGAGPFFLELRTYRFRAHSMADPELYRSKEEVDLWKKRCPVATFEARLRKLGLLDEHDLTTLEAGIAQEIAEAIAFAESGAWEPAEDLTKDVYTAPPRLASESVSMFGAIDRKIGTHGVVGEMKKATYREAIRAAMRTAIKADPRVFLMGEDVGQYGGAFAVSLGLLEEFGPERIRDTPLSESTFLGAGIGAALGGMRPIVEIMTVNFSLLALDQIVNNAATLRHMSGGQFSVPLVVRMATGGGRQLAAQHSHSLEGWYAHIPGIKVLAPATVQDANSMLLAALREPDPVFIFEHATLYALQGELADSPSVADIRHAAVRRPGSDVTLIAYGGSLSKTLRAADLLAQDGIDAEVIDLRTLRPLDTATILASVAKTHRAVVVDEAWRTGSFSAEISAQIMEGAFDQLDAPVARVCGVEVPTPYAQHLEQAALPQAEQIVAAVRAMI